MKTLNAMIVLLVSMLFSPGLRAQAQSYKSNMPSLTMSVNDNSVNLSWTTVREVNSSYFLLESSEDGVHFTTVKSTSASGSTMFAKTYDDVEDIPDSCLFYRVTLVDMNGKRNSSLSVCLHAARTVATIK